MSKKSFVKGAAILAAAGLLSKAIGAFFRIPLMNTIGTTSLGLYQMAYPIYSFLLIISTAGLPTAISKMVSERIAMGNYRDAHKVFKVSLTLLFVIGLATSTILLAGSGLAAELAGNPLARYSMLAIAPSLFFVSIISAFRGYFQGMQIMTPTAVSQIVEQAGKLLIGLWLAAMWIDRGDQYGAAGAVLGVTLSEVAALFLLLYMYGRKRKDILKRIKDTPASKNSQSNGAIIGRIAKIAVPVTIGASIMPLVNMADVAIVVNRLKQIGYTTDEATGLFGHLTGGANPLINFPAILTIALAMSLVPAISEAYAVRDTKGIIEKTTTGIRLTIVIGMPAAIGMAVLAVPICGLLYSSLPESEILIMGDLLRILSIGVIFLTLIQTLTGILQGINRIIVPVKNLFIGALFKIAITYILVGVPGINIRGAAIGTVVCYGIAAFLDFAAVLKYTKVPVSIGDFIVKPAVAVTVMGLSVSLCYSVAMEFVGSNTMSVLVSILSGVLIYGLMMLILGAIKESDLDIMPGGKRIIKIIELFRGKKR